MNSVVLTLVVVVLSTSHCQADGIIPCDQLPKEKVHGFDANSEYDSGINFVIVNLECWFKEGHILTLWPERMRTWLRGVLVVNSPYVYDYSLTSKFDCYTKVFTNPARGPTNYTGTSLSISGSNVTVADIKVSDDNKAMHATRCSTGESSTWYTLGGQVDDSGAFLCSYTCKGPLLGEFLCISNNNGTSPAELEAVKLAKTVSNGYLIHDARENCPARIGCNAF